jgi:hypothetical protein
MSDDPFDDIPVIYSFYSDEVALDEGVLINCTDWGVFLRNAPWPVARSVVTRATSHLMGKIDKCIDKTVGVDMPEQVRRALASLVLRVTADKAVMTEDKQDGYLLTSWLPDRSERVWFVQNEAGFYTAMLPADY